MRGIFVTGTDTGVGKTRVSCMILAALRERGERAVGMKPIASGCETTSEGLRNDDALRLQAVSEIDDYGTVNPIAFAPPIAPHIAAERENRAISLDVIERAYARLAARADRVVVEGAGGWRVPLATGGPTMAEIPKRLRLGVVLVVGIRLGCLSHALLTAEAVRADGLTLLGWVANCLDPDVAEKDAQIATLVRSLAAPLLGVVPYLGDADTHVPLDLDPIVSAEEDR